MLWHAVRAEVRKLTSVWTTWLGLGLSVLLAALTAFLAVGVRGDGSAPSLENPLAGRGTAVVGIVVIACLSVGEEYAARRRGDGPGARQVADSLRAVPFRGRWLAAKAMSVGAVTMVAVVLSVAVASIVASAVLGRPQVPTLGAFLGASVYWVLIGWLALAATFLARNAILPMVLLIVNHSMVSLSLLLSLLTPLARYLPDAAGLRLFGVVQPLPSLDPLEPVVGGLVMSAWSAAALAAAWLVLRRRDA